MSTFIAEREGRINVWPSSRIALLVASANPLAEQLHRMTVYDHTYQAIADQEYEEVVMSVILVDAEISSPQPYITLALPDSYSRFRLELSAIQFDATDNLALAFSYDGGVTYLADASNSDSYFMIGNTARGTFDLGSPTGEYFAIGDSIMDLTSLAASDGQQEVSSLLGAYAAFEFEPGAADKFTTGRVSSYYSHDVSDKRVVNSSFAAMVNPLATVAPTKQRATNLLILPYGNGNVPPTGTTKMISGAYQLVGF